MCVHAAVGPDGATVKVSYKDGIGMDEIRIGHGSENVKIFDGPRHWQVNMVERGDVDAWVLFNRCGVCQWAVGHL